MTIKTKGRAGWNRATPNTNSKRNSTRTGRRVKEFIIMLALWGLFPLTWAQRIDRIGRGRNG
jgi:hypothetical protein